MNFADQIAFTAQSQLLSGWQYYLCRQNMLQRLRRDFARGRRRRRSEKRARRCKSVVHGVAYDACAGKGEEEEENPVGNTHAATAAAAALPPPRHGEGSMRGRGGRIGGKRGQASRQAR